VSDEVNVIIKATIDKQSTQELVDFENEVTRVGSLWQRVKLKIRKESANIGRSIIGLLGFAQLAFDSVGQSIGPLGDALLSILDTVISGVIAMQYAYTAGGPTGWAMLAISMVALGVAINAKTQAIAGTNMAKQQAQESSRAIRSITSIISPWL